MIVGAFGPVVFLASQNFTNTFFDFKRKGVAQYADHKSATKKTVLEFSGMEPDEISFKIRFDVAHGLAPWAGILALRQIMSNGVVLPLMLGTYFYGFFVIKGMDEEVPHWDSQGRMQVATVSLTLKEYDKEVNVKSLANSAAAKLKKLIK